jgi:hypothetical protein
MTSFERDLIFFFSLIHQWFPKKTKQNSASFIAIINSTQLKGNYMKLLTSATSTYVTIK